MNNEENNNVSEIQTPNTQKSAKIDFRMPFIMKEKVLQEAKKEGKTVSQFYMGITEKFFEAQAKATRLAVEVENEKKRKVDEGYAQLDKKSKHKKGDFSVDEPEIKTDSSEKNFFIKVAMWLGIGGIVYAVIRFFTKKSSETNEFYFQQPQPQHYQPNGFVPKKK